VTERELDQLADLGHLLAASSNVIVSDVSKVGLLILALDRLALAVNHSVLGHLGIKEMKKDNCQPQCMRFNRMKVMLFWRIKREESTYDTVVGGVGFDDLELDRSHTTTDEEEIALADGSVGLEEVRLEVDLEEVSGDALDGVVDGEDVDALSILDISAGVKRHDISKTDTQVLADDCGTGSHRKEEKVCRFRVCVYVAQLFSIHSNATIPSPFILLLLFAIVFCI
jgi:hypothetical protein